MTVFNMAFVFLRAFFRERLELAAENLALRQQLAVQQRRAVFDMADGKLLREVSLPAAVVQDGIAVAGGRVFATATDGAVYCLGLPSQGSR